MDPDLIHRPLQHHLIVTTLTSQIANLVPDVIDETALGFEMNWGTDTKEWKEVCVYETLRHIVGQVTNRVFVGLPTCRDPALVDVAMKYAQDVPLTSMVLRMIPRLIKPLLVPIITLSCRIHTNQFYKIIKPTVERRLREFDARRADPEASGLGPKPNDYLEWSIAQAKELNEPPLWHPKKLADRVLILNFAAIHTSTFSITGAILDLVCHNKPEHIAELRAEIEAVLADHGGVWDKRSLAKMHKLDSTMRESVRLNSIVTLGLGRMVTAPEGIDTPSGIHVPRGVIVTTPGYSIMHDRDVYGDDAEEFRPFRFAEQRVEREGGAGYVERARKAFPTTSKEFLAFGHGKNACPGRFFAANELKLILGYMVLNYEFEMQAERPRNTWFGLSRVPPMKATIRIRRREKS
jgi:cytochrome P450